MQTESLPTVEGLSPAILWYTLVGIVALAAIFLIFCKVADEIRKHRERREAGRPLENERLVTEISEKVIEKIGERLDEIDRKLSNDKNLLDSHTRQINTLSSAYEDLQAGASVQSLALVAILGHELHNGNADEMQHAMNELNKYLAARPVRHIEE